MAAPKSGWAVVIDPDAGKPALVGSHWERREPAGDVWDGPVVVVGVFDNGPDAGGFELVVQPLEFGEPALTADPESFGATYRRVVADDPAERVSARLRELEARVA